MRLKQIGGILLFACIAVSCKDTENIPTDYELSADVMIKSFALPANDKVPKIENTFFTIDLLNAVVFNADSLPPATRVDSLKTTLTLANGATAKIQYIDYVENGKIVSADTSFAYDANLVINFTQKKINIVVTAANTAIKRTYALKLNVHKVNPSSWLWKELSVTPIPTATDQKSLYIDGKIIMFYHPTATTPLSLYNLTDFQPIAATLPIGADVRSMLYNKENKTLYYINGTDKLLYQAPYSTTALTPIAVGAEKWQSLITVLNNKVVGVVKADNNYYHATASANNIERGAQISAQFPLSGYSNVVDFSTQAPLLHQVAFVGGKLQNGSLTNGLFLYDGNNWIQSNLQITLPFSAREGASLFAFNTDHNQAYKVWFLIGGKNERGEIVKDIYLSNLNHLSWEKADTLMNLPDEIAPRAFASAIVEEEKVVSKSLNRIWKSIQLPAIKTTAMRAGETANDYITPYLYWVGGIGLEKTGDKYNEVLFNQMWRASIYKMIFAPID